MRVQLDNPRVEVTSERRHLRPLVICHSYNYIFGLETLLTGCHDKSVPLPPQPVHFNPVSHWQPKVLRVVSKVVSHLLLRGKSVARGREPHPRKSCIPRRIEEAERVPPIPPCVADSRPVA